MRRESTKAHGSWLARVRSLAALYRQHAPVRPQAFPGLPLYSWNFYKRASLLPGASGKVFIIGGTPEEAQVLRSLGAREVVVANPEFSSPWLEKRCLQIQDPAIQLIPSSAEEAQVEPTSFDLVLSTCVIEHILDIPSVLARAAEILKPGGKGLIHGGPVWTADRGHHVWVQIDGTRYFFNGKGDSQPILPWEHLLISCQELQERLKSRGVPGNHADRIVEHVYHSRKLNRLSPAEIEEMVLRSPLRCLSFTRHFGKQADWRTVRALSGRYSPADLGTWAIEFLFEKSG